MSFSEESVRAKFPALSSSSQARADDQQQQRAPVYLDNAGGSQTLGTVVDSVREYLSGGNVQLGASYEASRLCTERYSEAHAAAARFVNARAADEVVFGPSSTQLLRNLSYALEFRQGDELVISAIDHEANIAPWLDLAARQGLVVKWWRPSLGSGADASTSTSTSTSTSPELLPEDLAGLLSPRTRLVACTHVSNILGTITSIKAITQVAHSVGALVCVDGVAYAPHRPIDVQELGVDMYVFSWYKVYGAHLATLYVSWPAQLDLKSLGHFFNPSATLADKLALSAASYELCQAVTHVVDYLGPASSDMWMGIAQQESKLQSVLLDFLRQRSEVTIFGVDQGVSIRRVPTISFTVRGWDSKDFVQAAEKDSPYCFRWGSFYSNRLVRDTLRLGENGVVRVSMVHYNTLDEVHGLVKALDRVISSKK